MDLQQGNTDSNFANKLLLKAPLTPDGLCVIALCVGRSSAESVMAACGFPVESLPERARHSTIGHNRHSTCPGHPKSKQTLSIKTHIDSAGAAGQKCNNGINNKEAIAPAGEDSTLHNRFSVGNIEFQQWLFL